MLPVFPVRLSLMILPVVIAVVVLIVLTATDQGKKMFGRQAVAWFITSLMVVAAIGIGYAKAPVNNRTPEAAPQFTPPVSETVPPGYNSNVAMYIRDDANVLSASTENVLTNRIAGLINRYDVVIGVVTCNYGRDDLYNYAVKQAENMGLSGYDFIVVLDIRGDNYWLVQGAELADDFTDDDCGQYAWDYMEAGFAAHDYDSAVLSLTQALEAWYGTYFR